MSDTEDRKLTPEEEQLAREALQASEERDAALKAAQDLVVKNAMAAEVARENAMEAQRAREQAEQMNEMRRAAQSRAEYEARDAETSRFGFYLLLGVLVTAVLLAGIWFITKNPETEASSNTVEIRPNQTQPVPEATIPPAPQPQQPIVVPSPPVVVEKEVPAPQAEKPSTIIINPPAPREERAQPVTPRSNQVPAETAPEAAAGDGQAGGN